MPTLESVSAQRAGGQVQHSHREAEMGYEVDWATAVASAAPQVFALVADWDNDDDGTADGGQATGSLPSAPRTIAWGLQFPTHAVVWFADTAAGHGCATFASAERALVRLSMVFDVQLIWANSPSGVN